ncbi:MAG: esterase-like activity of phytase family protein [Bacteriovorax sp.]|nr:esterase-like activity of phytase family protein [Bacteriovorax sp.]
MKRHSSKNTFGIVLIALCATCIFTTTNAFAAEKLRFIADQNFPTGEKLKETEIGGLSGLAYDKEKNKILAISDDRSVFNDARFYEFDFKLDDKSFSVTPTDVVILKNKEGKPFKKGTIDFEGIAFYNGDLLVSSEGSIKHEPPILPEVILFTRLGAYKSNVEIPEKFFPVADKITTTGVRDNLSFESLTTTPDGKTVWVGTEEALNQDDRTSSPNYASVVRLIEYKDLKPVKEVAYRLEKVPSIKVAGLTVGETGLSDMLAIDENNFYSIERSYMPLAKKAVIRIFKNSINDKTTDISKYNSIKGISIKMVEKELIADLEEFSPQMAANFQKLGNIEGICFGPKLANGHNTIILVSDNNFNKLQRTQFLAFEIIP